MVLTRHNVWQTSGTPRKVSMVMVVDLWDAPCSPWYPPCWSSTSYVQLGRVTKTSYTCWNVWGRLFSARGRRGKFSDAGRFSDLSMTNQIVHKTVALRNSATQDYSIPHASPSSHNLKESVLCFGLIHHLSLFVDDVLCINSMLYYRMYNALHLQHDEYIY